MTRNSAVINRDYDTNMLSGVKCNYKKRHKESPLRTKLNIIYIQPVALPGKINKIETPVLQLF